MWLGPEHLQIANPAETLVCPALRRRHTKQQAYLCAVWGPWLYYCCLSQALDKVCSGQTLEEAEPCRNLALDKSFRAEQWRKPMFFRGSGEWAKPETGESSSFFSVPLKLSIDKTSSLASWQMRNIYKFRFIIKEQTKRTNFELKGNPLITRTGGEPASTLFPREILHLPKHLWYKHPWKDIGAKSSQCAALKRHTNMRHPLGLSPTVASWTKHS